MLGSAVNFLEMSLTVLGDPVKYYGEGMSDHAGLLLSIKPRKKESHIPKRISNHIARSPEFKELVQTYLKAADVSHMSTNDAFPCVRELIHEAAIVVRDRVLTIEPDSRFAVMQRLASCSRAVWNQDARFARLFMIILGLLEHTYL